MTKRLLFALAALVTACTTERAAAPAADSAAGRDALYQEHQALKIPVPEPLDRHIIAGFSAF